MMRFLPSKGDNWVAAMNHFALHHLASCPQTEMHYEHQTAVKNGFPRLGSAAPGHHGHEQSANGQPVPATDLAQDPENACRDHVFCLLRRGRLERNHADWGNERRGWQQEQDSKVVKHLDKFLQVAWWNPVRSNNSSRER